MNITRFVSRLSQPLLWSVSPQVAPGLWEQFLWAPCRTISTGKDQVNFGNVGKMSSDSLRDLDIYLGRWVHDPHTAQDQGPAPNRLQRRVTELSMKSYVSFARNNGTWKVEQGFVGQDKTISFDFKLGEAFWMSYPDNTVVKILIYHDGDSLVWGFHPVEAPNEVLKVVTEIKDYKLIWNTDYPDGTKSARSYQKE